VQIYINLRIFFSIKLPRAGEIILNFLNRVDLWLFPPLAFYSTYLVTTRYFPDHLIKFIAIMATSFMAATLTLFLIRPPKRRPVHWVKYEQ
jgi:hypothetical protein